MVSKRFCRRKDEEGEKWEESAEEKKKIASRRQRKHKQMSGKNHQNLLQRQVSEFE
jgi:uncharacterized protein YdaU (DUF1376 family)